MFQQKFRLICTHHWCSAYLRFANHGQPWPTMSQPNSKAKKLVDDRFNSVADHTIKTVLTALLSFSKNHVTMRNNLMGTEPAHLVD